MADLRDNDYRGFTGSGVNGWACWSGPADVRFDNFRVLPITSRDTGTSEQGDRMSKETALTSDAPSMRAPNEKMIRFENSFFALKRVRSASLEKKANFNLSQQDEHTMLTPHVNCYGSP